MRKLLFVMFTFLGVMLLACGEVKVAGGVSEETNTIAGVLEDQNGIRLANVPVSARKLFADSVWFLDTTSSKGHFSFELEKGEYAISAVQKNIAYYEVVDVEKNMDVKAVALPLDSMELVVKYSDGSLASGTLVSLPGTEISAKADSAGKLKIALPHAEIVVYVESRSKNYENVYFKVVNGRIAGPYSAQESLKKILDSDCTVLEIDTLVLPKKVDTFATWNISDMQNDKIVSGENTLYIYGFPLVKNGEMYLTNSSEFAVLESDGGAFNGVERFSASLKLNIVKMPTDSSYRKNILGKVGFGNSGDESAFSLALVKGECGAEKPMLAFFVADENTDFAMDCSNGVFASVSADEDLFIGVSFEKGNLNIYKNGLVVGSAKIGVSKLRNSSESIYVGKETVSMKISEITLGRNSLGAAEAFFEYSKGGRL